MSTEESTCGHIYGGLFEESLLSFGRSHASGSPFNFALAYLNVTYLNEDSSVSKDRSCPSNI